MVEHPVQYVARVTKFLDRMIQEHGDYLFAIFGFGCLALIAWVIARPRKHPVQDFRVTILPLGIGGRRFPEQEPEPPPPPPLRPMGEPPED